MCWQFGFPFTHEYERALDDLAVFLDKLQLSSGRVAVPSEIVRQEGQQVALVGRIEIVELVAFGFKNGNAIGIPSCPHGEDKIGIDSAPFPTLYAILRACDVAVPPSQCLLTVEINGDFAFFTVELVLVDRSE